MSGDVIQLEALSAKEKRSARFAALCWQQWARPEDWPDKLDLYEAAAYLRVDYKSVWRACLTGRDGKAKLRHQRIGTAYRINRADLDKFGVVDARKAAA